MDIEGATSLESLLSSPQPQGMDVQSTEVQHQLAAQQMGAQQPMMQAQPPMAPPMNTCTQEANPGSPAVVDTESKDKSKKKKYSKEEIQKLALYVLVAAVVVSLPMVQDKLLKYIPMLQHGGTGALVINGAIIAAVFYAILHFY